MFRSDELGEPWDVASDVVSTRKPLLERGKIDP
jgi:hypothetical protein